MSAKIEIQALGGALEAQGGEWQVRDWLKPHRIVLIMIALALVVAIALTMRWDWLPAPLRHKRKARL